MHIPVWVLLGQKISNQRIRALASIVITIAVSGVLHTALEKPANRALRRRLKLG